MSEPFSPLILPTEDNRGLQSSLLTVIDALNVVTPRLGAVEDILAAAGLATRRIGAIPMTWLGVWTASFIYLHGDVVTRNLLLMIANKTTTETPTLSANDWDLLIDGTATGGGGVLSTVRVFQDAVTTALTAVVSNIHFDAEQHDTNNLHDNVTNNNRLIADADGYWMAAAQWRSAVSNLTFQGIEIYHQVGLVDTVLVASTRIKQGTGVTSKTTINCSSGSFWMNSGDLILCRGQSFPNTDTVLGDATFFTMNRLRD